MSDPYYDPNRIDPYDPNRIDRDIGDSSSAGMWAGLALAALVILGGLLFFSSNPSDTTASNTTGMTTSRPAPSNPGAAPMPSPSSSPSTTGSAPAR